MNEAQEKKTLSLSTLSPARGSRQKPKRLGKGDGSGLGKTCGKGQKGQKSRSGASIPAGFEGGQMPLHRRLPKIGFTSRKRVRGENIYTVISLEKLLSLGNEGEVTIEVLTNAGLVRSGSKRVKILGGCACDKKLVVEAHAISASARAAIEGAGGEVRLV